jgi:folate-binding protein YgfZ
MTIKFSTSPALFAWSPASWLQVRGADAAAFLQGQFTNDLRGLTAGGGAVYGLWLSVKGKVIADSFVLRGKAVDEFWVGSYFSAAAVIRERLESHVIADEVEITDETEAWVGVTWLGAEPEAVAAARRGTAGLVFAGRRGEDRGTEWMYRLADGQPAALERSGAETVSAEEMERRRIAAGIPAVPRDIGPGDLPNEAGLESEAISYTKGCYLGQEVMARLKSMGQVRRRLVRVRGAEGDPPATPAAVFAGPRAAGELRSAVRDGAGGWIGLALVSRLHVTADAALGLEADGPARMQCVDAP